MTYGQNWSGCSETCFTGPATIPTIPHRLYNHYKTGSDPGLIVF